MRSHGLFLDVTRAVAWRAIHHFATNPAFLLPSILFPTYFLAAFAGGLGFRRYERDHEVNRRVHDGAELLEKFGELALILLLGSMVTFEGLGEPEVSGWLLVPLLLLVIRPATVLLALLGSRVREHRERTFVAWFGVRGIGSLYYAAVAAGSGVLAEGEARRLFWTVAACVLVSIVVHGITAALGTRSLLERAARRA